jgi:MFS family permease
MHNVAQAWLVYRLTESSFYLGLVAFSGLFPVLLFSLLGGFVADRFNRHRILVIAHTLGMVQALVLAFLVLSGHVHVWHVIVLAILLGIVHAFEMPARHSFIADMVPREHLPNAIALNSSAFNIARFMGPALAGFLIAAFGEGTVFILNACSFLAILAGLLSMKSMRIIEIDKSGTPLNRIKEGFSFAWNTIPIRAGLLHLAVFSLVGTSMTVLMPVFTREVFSGNSGLLGILLGCMGAGALTGAFILAHRSRYEELERQIGLAGVIAGVCLSVFSFIKDVSIVYPLLVLFGFCQTILAASTNTLVQSSVSDRLRGRVMSIFSMIFIGMMPLGGLMAGTIAEKTSASFTVLLLGMISILVSSIFLYSKKYYSE